MVNEATRYLRLTDWLLISIINVKVLPGITYQTKAIDLKLYEYRKKWPRIKKVEVKDDDS